MHVVGPIFHEINITVA